MMLGYTGVETVVIYMSYTITRTVDDSFESVRAETEAALSEEGFGILSDIDMGSTLEEKVGEDFRRYRILGACNPPLAYESLSLEIDLGTLLPCNVAIYESDEGDVVVSAIDPTSAIDLASNPELDEIASEVRDRLVRALDSVVSD